MIIDLSYKGLDGIEEFSNTILEINIPPEPSQPYKYIHSIEYQLIKNLSYKVVLYDRELINSNQNPHGAISGITLKMFDDMENRKQINLYQEQDNSLSIRFNPYEIYRGCLDLIIKPENAIYPDIRTHINNMEIYFTCELNNFSYDNILISNFENQIYQPINSINDKMISASIIETLNNQEIKWQTININNEDENPIKKHKQ